MLFVSIHMWDLSMASLDSDPRVWRAAEGERSLLCIAGTEAVDQLQQWIVSGGRSSTCSRDDDYAVLCSGAIGVTRVYCLHESTEITHNYHEISIKNYPSLSRAG